MRRLVCLLLAMAFLLPPVSPAAAAEESSQRRILYYRNPMGLPDTSPVPKKDGMGMDYIPVYADEAGEGNREGIRVSPARLQQLGVRIATVQKRPLAHTLQLFGTVAYDESRLTAVTPRFDGYISSLFGGLPGETVRAGEPLADIYSPEIWRHGLELRRYAGTRDVAAVRERLKALGIPPTEIARLERGEAPQDSIRWPAPVDGVVIERNVVRGQGFRAGDTLYRIADLSALWVMAQVFTEDLAFITTTQKATITTTAWPGRSFEGEVRLILPDIDPVTRTARVRIEVANPDHLLRPGMYVNVALPPPTDTPPVLVVPESAILDDGRQQTVLIAKGDGGFTPRPVSLGQRADGLVEVRRGVQAGEQVASSATFLIDAESDIRAALEDMKEPAP